MELDKNTQESEPTPQALSDGILVVGISSKGPRDFFGVRIRYGETTPRTPTTFPTSSCQSTSLVNPIKYNGNIATLAGIVYEVGQYAKSTGVLQLFLEHRAVDVGKGIIAVEDSSIPFTASGLHQNLILRFSY